MSMRFEWDPQKAEASELKHGVSFSEAARHMNAKSDADDLREEYDFTPEQLRHGVRGKYAERLAQGTNLVPLDADVA
jgi:uncharacterized DUF497 family protein